MQIVVSYYTKYILNLSLLFQHNLVWGCSSGFLTPESPRRGRVGPCHTLPQEGFSASGANSGRCRWSPLGSMNYHDFAHPFNGLERIYAFLTLNFKN